MLASLLFPYDEDAPGLIDSWLAELEAQGMAVRYSVDGSSYLQIVNFLKHQKIDHPSPSKLPAFDESSRIIANPREPSGLDQGSGSGVDQGVDQGSPVAKATGKRPPKQATDTDPRYQHFVGDIDTYWKTHPGHAETPLPMDAGAGKNLKAFLKSHPKLTRDDFQQWLENMYASENINPAWNAREILSKVHLYADGPLNVFSRPNGSANGKHG